MSFIYLDSNLCGRPSLFNYMHQPCMLASSLFTCEAVVGCVLGVENIKTKNYKNNNSKIAMFYYCIWIKAENQNLAIIDKTKDGHFPENLAYKKITSIFKKNGKKLKNFP